MFVNKNEEELVGLGGDTVPLLVAVSFLETVIPDDVPESVPLPATDVCEETLEMLPLSEGLSGSVALVTVTASGSEDEALAVTPGARVVSFPLAAVVLPAVPVPVRLVALDNVYGGTGVICGTETDELANGEVLELEKVLCSVLLGLLLLVAEFVVASVAELLPLLETAKEVKLPDAVLDPVEDVGKEPPLEMDVATVRPLEVLVSSAELVLDVFV